MKKIIRHRASQLYLHVDGSWTARTEEAESYRNVGEALSIVYNRKLTDVELVYLMEEVPGPDDMVIPLDVRWSDGALPKSGNPGN